MPENLEVDEKVTTFAHVNETSRDGAEVARWAHNPKVVCSSQASATKLKVISLRYDLFCLCTPYILSGTSTSLRFEHNKEGTLS